MRKIIVIAIVIISLILLSFCSPTKYYDEEITVVFFTGDGDQIERYLDVEANSLVTEPAVPTNSGYTFNGWYSDFQNTTAWDFAVDKVGDKSIVLYAEWVPGLLDIIYDINDGIIVGDYDVTFLTGGQLVLPLASRTGFTFEGWYLYDWVDESSTIPGDRQITTIPEGTVSDLYIYAHWAPVSVQVTLKANYPIDDEGPDNPAVSRVDYGSEIAFPVFEDTTEYEFLGWNTRSDGTGTFYINGELFIRTQRTVLYAAWQLK